jgi:hypothetical protein
MISRSVVRTGLAALVGLSVLVPAAASGQQASGIAGVVRDTSGAVLPGVAVEAASPALIEKVRLATSDGEGRYNIADLRPGTYVVTFTLAGFNTVRREGITLTAGFTAGVDAELRVGALEETVTVSGAAPLVDTHNVRQQQTVSAELIDTLPSGAKGFMGIARLVPGMTGGSDSGGASGIYSSNSAHASTLHGKGGIKMSYDGMQTSNLSLTGHTSYVMNPATVEETTVETGGVSAESDATGVRINLVPKEGSNAFRFGADFTYTSEHLQSDNLTDTLRARGVTSTNKVLNLYDVNVTSGGPIKRDRLWFFTATRFSGNRNEVQGIYFNKTRGTPFYTPDLDRPAFRKEWLKSQGGRVTWQVSPKNKVNVFADLQQYDVRGRGANEAPEAQTCWKFWPAGLYQATWGSPVTSKFLLEAGASLTKNLFPCTREDVTSTFDFTVSERDISILEASTGFRYNAKANYLNVNDMDRYVERFSASYITGTHALKAGIQIQQHVHNVERVVNGDVNYTFLRGVPTTITQFTTPNIEKNRTKADLGLFVQDQWAIRRLTLNYGLRLDYFNGYVPEQHVPAGQFVAARQYAPVYGVPRWTDVSPRLGASYNLFGDGRTALKATLGRYVGKASSLVAQNNNPVVTSINSVTRAWNDTNGNYVPECDLRNFGLNGECGPISNVNFGQINPNAIRYAEDLIRGSGSRDYFWDVSAEVQRELGEGTSITAGYYRNWTDHFGLVIGGRGDQYGWPTGHIDNLAVTPGDFDPYCITAPADSRLPGGGGYQVCGLYDIAPAKFGLGDQVYTRASNYDRPDGGKGKFRYSDFVGISINSRLGPGATLGGSVDTGRSVTDSCFVVDSPQELLNCRVITPFKAQTQIKVFGSYPLPAGFSVSGVLQNLSGIPYDANYAAPNDEIARSLGRNLAACGGRAVCTATTTVPLVPPMTLFESRRTLLDLRASRTFSLGRTMRVRANFDVYNVLNDSSLVGINNTYGSNWRRPLAGPFDGGLVDGRLIQFGGQLTF